MMSTKRRPSEFLDQVGDLVEQLERAQAERVHLIASPPPPTEREAVLDQEVKRLGGAWLESNASQILKGVSPAVEAGADGSIKGIRGANLAAAFPGYADLGMLCALAPDLVREQVRMVIRRAQDTPGPPTAQRVALLNKLDQQIQTLRQQHAALVDQAVAAGVPLPHLPEEAARRIAVQERRAAAERFNLVNLGAIQRGTLAPLPIPSE